MKITRRQLRQIIKEEFNLLSEVDDLPIRGTKVKWFKEQTNIPTLAKKGKLWGVADNEGRIALIERPGTGDGIRHTGYVVDVGRSSDGIYKILEVNRNEIKLELVTFPGHRPDGAVSTETKDVKSLYFSRALKDGPDYTSGGGEGSQWRTARDINKHAKKHSGTRGIALNMISTKSTSSSRPSGGGQSSGQSSGQSAGTSAPKGSKPSGSRPAKGGSGAPQRKGSSGR